MALVFNGNQANYLTKSIAFSANTGTICAWVKIVTDRNAYSTFFYMNDTDNEQFVLQTGADGTTLSLYTYDGSVTGTSLTAGTWYHLALTWDGTTAKAYLNGTLDISNSNTGSDWAQVTLGRSASFWDEPLNGHIAHVKAWNATLSAAQIQQEMRTVRPLNLTSLLLWMPTLAGSGIRNLDYSGSGNTLTVNGTITDADNPPVAWGAPVWVVPVIVAGGTDALEANGITTGAPTLDTPTLAQIHVLSAATIVTGSPALGTPTLAQVHALVAAAITTGTPTLGAPTLAQVHALTAADITTGTPTLGTPTLGQIHALSASDITTGVPVLDAPTIAQIHALVAAAITTGAPTLGLPTLAQIHALSAGGITTGTPVLDTPSMAGESALTADGITAGAPTLGTPVIAQIHALVAVGIATGAPTLGTPDIAQAHALSAAGITTGAADVGVPVIGQIHVLTAVLIVAGTPTLGAPALNLPVVPTPTPRIWVIEQETRTFVIDAEDRVYTVSAEDRTYTVQE